MLILSNSSGLLALLILFSKTNAVGEVTSGPEYKS